MNDKNRKFAVITVDTNDADYLTQTIEVSEEQVLILARVANAIKEFKPYQGKEIYMGHNHNCKHNFPIGECLREDLGEMSSEEYYVEDKKTISREDYQEFLDLLPYGEYGSHTVTGIKILAVIGEIKLI